MLKQSPENTAARHIRRAVCRHLHVKQFQNTERLLGISLARFFQSQISDAKKRLSDMGGDKAATDQASSMRQLVYEPREWRRKLIDAAFPPLAKGMIEAARAQLLMMGMDPNKSTASEWLQDENIDLGDVEGLGIATEMPQWMKDAIEIQLRETFEQDYWKNILETTGTDIEEYLRDGLQEGLSIRELARNINRAFPSAYSMRRAVLIARTESGNALNSARALAVDHLKEELGEAGTTIRKEWLSVLGNTTRDSHAALDGVPADENGLWNLDGVRVPWPSHWSLPAKNRVNCQCTITTGFGIDEEEFDERIGEQRNLFDVLENDAGLQTKHAKLDQIGTDTHKKLEDLKDKMVKAKDVFRDAEQKHADVFDELIRRETEGISEGLEELEAESKRLWDEKEAKGEVIKEIRNAISKVNDDRREKALRILSVPVKDRLNLKVKMMRQGTLEEDDGVRVSTGKFTHLHTLRKNQAVQFLNRITAAKGGVVENVQLHVGHEDSRAFYRGPKHFAGITSDDRLGVHVSERHTQSVYVHELGHHLENMVPGIQAKANEFLDERIRRSGTPTVSMKETWGGGYKDYEQGNQDDFLRTFGLFNPKYDKNVGSWPTSKNGNAMYAGKRYSTGDTEVVSMGVEKLYEDPVDFAERDPEYFKFIVGVLDGTIR